MDTENKKLIKRLLLDGQNFISDRYFMAHRKMGENQVNKFNWESY
jgi:hypothetical protein